MIDIRKEFLDKKISNKSIQIRSSLKALIENPKYLESPEEIGKIITTELCLTINQISDDLILASQKLHAQIESESRLNLSPLEAFSPDISGSSLDLSKVNTKREKTWWDTTRDVGRQASFETIGHGFSMGVIGTIAGLGFGLATIASGGVIPMFAAGIIPQLVGASLAGTGIGVGIGGALSSPDAIRRAIKEHKQMEQNAIKREVLDLIRPHIDESLTNCRRELDKGITNIERCLRDDLKNKIAQERETADRALNSIKEAYHATQVQTTQKLAQLKSPLDQLNQLLSKVENMAKALIAEYEVR